ncbi:MAG: two-component sensor histidine kinase [Desulfobacterales bacterium]|nr:MAG: two-component sensor histidine kinase [Desulfobacterales bacterium]
MSNETTPEERIKPFRLVKFFTYSSFGALFLGSVILCLLNLHWSRELQFRKSEEYARLLIENLNHQIYTQFQVPVYYFFGKIQLRDQRQFDLMDKIVRNTLHSFKVDMVNLYDASTNIISYSFTPDLVGEMDQGGTEYRDAVKGVTTTRVAAEGGLWASLTGTPARVKVTTFAPLREAKPLTPISGKVLGVIEIVQDLSEEYKAVIVFQTRIVLSCFVVMGLLMATLVFIVKKGENIIERRNRERIRLKEKLNQSERLSALGEMVAGISHEIRNPLGIILSSASLLKKKIGSGGHEASLSDIILEESTRLNDIITDFLTYARPKPPHLTRCRLAAILSKNIQNLKIRMPEPRYLFRLDLPEDLPDLMADEQMLYQAFLNVLLNAAQAMPNGGEIQVSARLSPGFVRLAIMDKGPGVPPETREKIWDPFYTTKDTGTGLGMGIVKNIIESHAGRIRIENRPVYGCQVVMELPLAAPPAANEGESPGIRPPSEGETGDLWKRY